MSDDTPEIRDEYVVTVLRSKGQPIRAAYCYNVTPTLTLEGTCRVVKGEIDPEVWAEFEYLQECGILDITPYVPPEDTEPDEKLLSAADAARKAIDGGSMSGPFPDTDKPNPPPPLLKVHDPIRVEKPDWEQARKEALELLDRPDPRVHDAVTGEQTGGPKEIDEPEIPPMETEPPVEESDTIPTPEPTEHPEPETATSDTVPIEDGDPPKRRRGRPRKRRE